LPGQTNKPAVAYLSDASYGTMLIELSTNIRLDLMRLALTNALAYNFAVLITTIKSFIVQVPGAVFFLIYKCVRQARDLLLADPLA